MDPNSQAYQNAVRDFRAQYGRAPNDNEIQLWVAQHGGENQTYNTLNPNNPQYQANAALFRQKYGRAPTDQELQTFDAGRVGQLPDAQGPEPTSYLGPQKDKYGNALPPGFEGLWDKGLSQLGTAGRDRFDPLAKAADTRQIVDPATMKLLQDRAFGRTPSAAEIQMGRGIEQSISAERAAGASQRGGNVGANAQFQALNAQDVRAQGVGQASELRAQEQAASVGQLVDTQMQTRQMNDALMQNYLQMGYSIDEAQRATNMQIAQWQAQAMTKNQEISTQNTANMLNFGSQQSQQGYKGISDAGATWGKTGGPSRS